jgi:hypothetical protein
MGQNNREICNYMYVAQLYPRNDKRKNLRTEQINRHRIPLRTNQIRSELNFPAERYGGFEPQGVSDIVTLARS